MTNNDNFEKPSVNNNQETNKFINPESNQNNQEEHPNNNNPEILDDLLV